MNRDKNIALKQLATFMVKNDITLLDVVDTVIKQNGIIGVGLITLKDHINKHINEKLDKTSNLLS